MAVFEIPQASVDWIKNDLGKQMDEDTAEGGVVLVAPDKEVVNGDKLG